jgi:Flp pilus assembly pilin Flp
MKQLVARFLRDEQGQDIIEYALLASFVSLGAYVGADALGKAYNTWMNDMTTAVGVASTKVKAIK